MTKLEPPETRRAALEKACARALSVGLTSIQCLEGGIFFPEDDVLAVMAAAPALPVHTLLWYQTTDIARVKELGLPRIGGCILVDGAPGSYTGALFEPYSDNPSTNGLLYFGDDELNSFVLAAHRAGFPIAMHATCQRAVEQLLRAYEQALDAEPKDDHRFRIEHCYGLPTAAQFERMGRRGIICSTQPAFLHFRMDMYYRRFGERWPRVHPHRLALDHGVLIAGGSDSFVTPLYPLLGIHSAVNHPVPEQRVSAAEALRWFTINAAFAAFEERDKGSITPGKLADLTVLGRDILSEDPLAIKDIPVDMTIVAGVIRYRSSDESNA
jgi:predicted amidohydrolase YtcJ